MAAAAGTVPPYARADAAHEAGRAVYNARCYFCHGYSGDARTVAATVLRPPPRDFTRASPEELAAERIRLVLRDGIPGTAMASFAGTLSDEEMRSVAAFVEREFVRQKAPNTRYHTPDNGWSGHERYAEAFAFARGERAIDVSEQSLTEAERRGQRLFLSSCITCHEPRRAGPEQPLWEPAGAIPITGNSPRAFSRNR